MLIDVNTREQFAKETIPGAINIPLEELDEGLKNIPKDTVLVFACNRGPRSSQGAKIAEAAGFTSSTFRPIMKWKDGAIRPLFNHQLSYLTDYLRRLHDHFFCQTRQLFPGDQLDSLNFVLASASSSELSNLFGFDSPQRAA